jgi:hypothetical protein
MKGKRMSFNNWSRIVCLLPFAIATSAAPSAQRHNLVVLVPTALPAAAVNEVTAPALSKLRSEGVYFSNSHSGFPRLVTSGPDATGAHTDMLSVLAAATGSYSTALVDSTSPDEEPTLLATALSDSGSSLDMIVDVTLPGFKAASRPFVLVYRFGPKSEASEQLPHRHTDRSEESALVNAAITANEALAAIEEKLRQLGLHETTNIIVAAEQGLSLVWKGGKQNGWINLAAEQARWGSLPPGFLAMDLAIALSEKHRELKLFDPDNDFVSMKHAGVRHPRFGNGVIAVTPDKPLIFIEARGDHDLIYLSKNFTSNAAKRLAKDIVKAVFQFSYTSGVFVNEIRLGRPRGTLPLKHIGWSSSPEALFPDIVVTFASVGLQCGEPALCTHAIADTMLKEGQVLQGSFSRADTWNFMAARGPDFRSRLNSAVPASNADVVRTMRELLHLSSPGADSSSARVLVESLRSYEGKAPQARKRELVSRETRDGLTTEIHLQLVGETRYFHAAGGPGWTVGIPLRPASLEWRPWKWDLSVLRRVRVNVSPKDPPPLERAPPVFPAAPARP